MLLLIFALELEVWVRLGKLQVGSYGLEQGPEHFFCKGQIIF